MTYYCVYNQDTGNLVDVNVTPPSEIESNQSLAISEGDIPDRYFYTWDKNTKSFVPREDVSRQVSILQFLNRFTAQERISIKSAAKTNDALADYFEMLQVASYISLDDPTLFGGLSFLAYLGLIEPTRIQEILG